ncbi:MAG: hypothetical protein AB1414_17940 [bacterium]
MAITYPVFLIDRDKWMYKFNSINELRGYIELIDVEDNEYKGWDINGFPLDLVIDNREIQIKQIDNDSQIEELRNSILNYTKLFNPKTPFKYSGPENDFIELFNAAEKHAKMWTFRERFKRLFKKS